MIFQDNGCFQAFSWFMLLAHQLFPGKMRWNTSKYALLTFLLTPLFPAKILFSQLYFVTESLLTLCGPSLIRIHRNTLMDFLPYHDPQLLGTWRASDLLCLPFPFFLPRSEFIGWKYNISASWLGDVTDVHPSAFIYVHPHL